MNRIMLAGTAALLVGVAACEEQQAPPPPPPPEGPVGEAQKNNAAASIRARQTHYKQIGKSMKAIGEELKQDEPSLEDIRINAAQIAEFAPQVLGWFPAGSGSEAGLKTRARQDVWADPDGFRRAAERFIASSERFHDIAQTGDLAAIRAGRAELGDSCKNCHEDFRAPEE